MIGTEALIRRSQSGDEQAKELLVEQNTGLIWSVARKFIGRGTEAEDLFQLGCLGFLKAIEGFDPAYGTQFSTYAVPKISGEIRRFLRDDGAVKVSRSIKERAVAIKNARNLLISINNTDPTLEQIMDLTGFTEDEIVLAENATQAVESIHHTSGEDGFSLEHILSDTASEDTMLERIMLKNAIVHLSQRESTVIHLRYFHGLTQERVARVLNVSQVQVSRIEKKSIEKLRDFMSAK